MKFDNNDLNKLRSSLPATTSNRMASEIFDTIAHNRRVIADINRQTAERNATLVAGAEASIEQNELLKQQLEFAQKQNGLLFDNYEKLTELFDAQVQANKEAKTELEQSRRFNKWMMIIAIIAMLAAIASPIATVLVSQ